LKVSACRHSIRASSLRYLTALTY